MLALIIIAMGGEEDCIVEVDVLHNWLTVFFQTTRPGVALCILMEGLIPCLHAVYGKIITRMTGELFV